MELRFTWHLLYPTTLSYLWQIPLLRKLVMAYHM